MTQYDNPNQEVVRGSGPGAGEPAPKKTPAPAAKKTTKKDDEKD